MPGLVLHVSAMVTCPHGGQVFATSSNNSVMVSNEQVVTSVDTFTVVGCGTNHPCVTVRWNDYATRVFVNNHPALLNTNLGLCQSGDQSPQGPPIITSTQVRVKGV